MAAAPEVRAAETEVPVFFVKEPPLPLPKIPAPGAANSGFICPDRL